jgi:hypothetical protein
MATEPAKLHAMVHTTALVGGGGCPQSQYGILNRSIQSDSLVLSPNRACKTLEKKRFTPRDDHDVTTRGCLALRSASMIKLVFEVR